MSEGTLLAALSGYWAGAMERAIWQGSIALALAWGFTRLVPRTPADARCWLWRLAYLKLFLVALWPGRIELPILPTAPPRPSAHPARHAVVRMPATPSAAERLPLLAPSSVAPRAPSPSDDGRSLPGTLWLIGVAVGLARIVQRRRETQRLRSRCAPILDRALRDEVTELRRRLGMRAAPELLAGDVRTPLLIGLRRPAIVLPAAGSIGRDARSWVLAHELAHVRRRDLLWGCLPALARLLFFFHPLVLATRREWHLAHETACDALAIRITRAPVADYAAMLVSLATGRPNARLEGALGVSGPRLTLERRLRMLQYLRPPSRRRNAAGTALLIAVAIVGLAPWRVSARSEPAPANPQSRLGEQWEDLLLMDAVRYLGLTTDQMARLRPLAGDTDQRLSRLRAQEERTNQALVRIAEKQYAALKSGKPISLQEQADALAMERIRRGRKEQTLAEIAASIAPRLARVLTREQVRRAYLLAHGEMPPNVPPRPALLDPESGFVVEAGARETMRADMIRRVLARRYPAALVDAMATTGVKSIFIRPAAPGGEALKAGVFEGATVSFTLEPSNDPQDDEAAAAAFPPAQREAVRRDRDALESRWSEMKQLLLKDATEEEIVATLRPLARRMFGSPRLKPVLAEVLGG